MTFLSSDICIHVANADLFVESIDSRVTIVSHLCLNLSLQVKIRCHITCTVLSLTSHADIKWVQSCCKHFDNDLIWVVDDGETGIFSEP